MINDDGNCAGSSWIIWALLWAAQDPGRLKDMLEILNAKAAEGAFQGLSGEEKVILYGYSLRLPSTVYHLQSMSVISSPLCCCARIGTNHYYATLDYRSFAVTINSWRPLPLPSTSLNHKASCISMSPVLPPTVFINSSSRYLMLSCCLPALLHYACGLHIQTERWVARSCANPCLWRHDSDGRHRDASGKEYSPKSMGVETM